MGKLQDCRVRLRDEAVADICKAVNKFGVCVVHNFFQEYPNYPVNIPVFINASAALIIGDTFATEAPTKMLCKIADELNQTK